jgi:hypothetical protein
MHLAVILLCALATITPVPIPTSPHESIRDEIQKRIVRVWTIIVDQQNAKGAKLDDLFDILAGDPFFDIREQTQLHPNYSEYVKAIAARRPSTVDPDVITAMAVITLGKNHNAIVDAEKSSGGNIAMNAIGVDPKSAAAQFGGMLGSVGISAALLIWWIRAWNRRAERKIPPKNDRGRHYRSLLLRMSWRYVVVIGSLLLGIDLIDFSGNYSQQQMLYHAAFFYLMVFIFLAIIPIYSWTLTKRRFHDAKTATP